MPSLPARGAWIEIKNLLTIHAMRASRSPHGERGLKFRQRLVALEDALSLPARGAWIEIGYIGRSGYRALSLPARGAWIEITLC